MLSLLTKRNLTLIVLLISLASVGGSLYYSEIAGLEPCLLCWYQRIVMYPLLPLSIVALIRKSGDLPYYGLPLSLIGTVLAAYHYSLQKFVPVDASIPCSLNGPSCSGIYLQYFGFVTIPFMSLVAFIIISIVFWLILRVDK